MPHLVLVTKYDEVLPAQPCETCEGFSIEAPPHAHALPAATPQHGGLETRGIICAQAVAASAPHEGAAAVEDCEERARGGGLLKYRFDVETSVCSGDRV